MRLHPLLRGPSCSEAPHVPQLALLWLPSAGFPPGPLPSPPAHTLLLRLSPNPSHQDGNYSTFFSEGSALGGPGPVTIRGVQYNTLTLMDYWSAAGLDNAATTNGPPSAAYDTPIPNGFVLDTQAPGTVPLQLFNKTYPGGHVDLATFASPQGLAWANSNGYTLVGVVGYSFFP